MTGQIATVVPERYLFARGMEYGFMQAVATLYFNEVLKPSTRTASVIVGWRREWSIIFERMGRETLTVGGAMMSGVVGGSVAVQCFLEGLVDAMQAAAVGRAGGVRVVVVAVG